MEINLRTISFKSPSDHMFTIREQNGEDEDILSNPRDSKDLTNLTKFIAAIVVKTDFTNNGKLTVDDALNLPLLDRYCILLESRRFSLGDTLDITYNWLSENGKSTQVDYEELISNYLFDYGTVPTEEEMEAKPFACPFYPSPDKLKERVVVLASGKVVAYDCMTGEGERYLLNLPEEKRTRNSELLARNLKLEVNGKFEKVQNFSNFSVRDMAEIRKEIATMDPLFQGLTKLDNPETGETIMFPIMASQSFFYLTEA